MSTNVYQVYHGVYTNTYIYLLRAHNDRQATSLIIFNPYRIDWVIYMNIYIYIYKCGSNNTNEY
jgi:hypothetical protein